MFHITPTPTSWMLWAAIYVVAVLVIVSDTGIKGEKK